MALPQGDALVLCTPLRREVVLLARAAWFWLDSRWVLGRETDPLCQGRVAVKICTSLQTTALLLGSVLALGSPAQAQDISRGFAVSRFQPTSAGEWSFWVDHPWFSSTRYIAVGGTLGYAHNPVVFTTPSADGLSSTHTALIEHQLMGHIDLAGSFLDRVQINASLPVTFLETGTDVASVNPANGVALGDPRFGLWVRLFGQPSRSPISLSLGGQLWVPLRANGLRENVALSSSDEGVLRVMPKVALAGYDKHLLWSFSAGFLYRPSAQLGDGTVNAVGSTAGSELHLGARMAYADYARGFAIGPEVILATEVLGGASTKPFSAGYTSLEVLVAGHYSVGGLVNVGLAGGIGQFELTGTPDARALLRLAYAPMKREPKPVADRDRDQVPDNDDACPELPGYPSVDLAMSGCPDRDRDGTSDALDLCPETPQGASADPQRRGCPAEDRDHDGLLDPNDRCPDEAQGKTPDPKQPGCPARDGDGDGVLDPDDQCPSEAKGEKPDAAKPGCPSRDRDGDGVVDAADSCPEVAAGSKPDPARAGCPAGDRDRDFVVDHEDACPEQPGVPDADPKKNGCPSVVAISNGQITINEAVYFANKKDKILPRSFPVLQAVVRVLQATPQIKKIRVEGHTDDRGKPDLNRDLSTRRAQSVQAHLVRAGMEAARVEAQGYGPDRPIADNKSRKGREKNRRVDFVIVDPPQPQSSVQAAPVGQAQAPAGNAKRPKKDRASKKKVHQ